MKKQLRKMVTLGLATIITVSCSSLAFAASYGVSEPLGDGAMWCYVSTNGQSANASIETSDTSDVHIYGQGWEDSNGYFHGFDGYYGQTTAYGTGTFVRYGYFTYAEATFEAWANNGGYNSVFVNCSE